MKQREQCVVREMTDMWDYETVIKPKDNSSPEQTGAAGKTRNTQMLEDVEEPMPTERYQTNAESAVSPLEETDILLLSRDEEMEGLRSLSILNPEEMDDTELLKDLSSLGKPPSFDGKDTMLVNTAVDTRETFILEPSGQRYRKEILPLGEQVLARRPGARVNEHHRAIREMDCRGFSTLTKLMISLLRYSDKFRREPSVMHQPRLCTL